MILSKILKKLGYVPASEEFLIVVEWLGERGAIAQEQTRIRRGNSIKIRAIPEMSIVEIPDSGLTNYARNILEQQVEEMREEVKTVKITFLES